MASIGDLQVVQRSRTGIVCLTGAALGTAVALINYWPAVAVCAAVALAACSVRPEDRRRYLPLCVVIVSLLLPIPWPLPAVLAILAFCVFRAPAGVGIGRDLWFRRWDPISALLVAVLAVLVGAICAALVPVAMAGHYMYVDISEPPWWQIAGLVVAASVINSATEEIVWRGMLWSAATSAGLRPVSVVALTAVSFGMSHWQGYPGGWAGVAAATLLGVALGWLRLRTSSLLAPFAVHLAADLVLFSGYVSFVIFRQLPG